MSQAKVDKYKDYKKNRREIIKREKRKMFLTKVLIWVVVAVVVVGISAVMGVSFYSSYQAKLASMPSYKTTSFMLSDYAGMQETDEADEAVTESETEAETEETSETAEETSESADEAETESE